MGFLLSQLNEIFLIVRFPCYGNYLLVSQTTYINQRYQSQESKATEYCSILLQANLKTLSNKNDLTKKNNIFHFDILSEILK